MVSAMHHQALYMPNITDANNKKSLLSRIDLGPLQDILSRCDAYVVLGFARTSQVWPPFRVEEDRQYLNTVKFAAPDMFYIVMKSDGTEFQSYRMADSELIKIQVHCCVLVGMGSTTNSMYT